MRQKSGEHAYFTDEELEPSYSGQLLVGLMVCQDGYSDLTVPRIARMYGVRPADLRRKLLQEAYREHPYPRLQCADVEGYKAHLEQVRASDGYRKEQMEEFHRHMEQATQDRLAGRWRC